MFPLATTTMTDIVFITATLIFFAAGAFYARYCESL